MKFMRTKTNLIPISSLVEGKRTARKKAEISNKVYRSLEVGVKDTRRMNISSKLRICNEIYKNKNKFNSNF